MKLLNYLFPKQCLNCSSFGEYLCNSCEHEYIKRNLYQLCHVCKKKTNGGELMHKTCQSTTKLDGVIVCCKYNNLIERLIAELKYNFYTDIANYLITYYLEGMDQLRLQDSEAILIPIPMFPKKQRARGFNQASLIAKKLSSETGAAYKQFLIRNKNTQTQVGMSRVERIKNLEGVFEFNLKTHVTEMPSSVILVDDVMTTGTTLEECAETLKTNGIQKVFGLVFARG